MFDDNLQEYLNKLKFLHQRGASEASIRDAFLDFLRKSFPNLESTETILLEQRIPALRVRGGYVDALYGDLVFEFKRKLNNSTRQEGLEQLRRYLKNQPQPEKFFGLLTDGEIIEAFSLRDNKLVKLDEIKLELENSSSAKVWLDCYLFHERGLIPNARDIVLRFGERSPTFCKGLEILNSVWQIEKNKSSVQTKFLEWKNLLSIVYGSSVGDEELFLRHTYLSLFARLLAFVAIRNHAPKNEDIEDILRGSVFERMGFDNFVADDFFTWLPPSHKSTRILLKAIATRLTCSYNLGRISEDLLKELYQELVDPETRHDLGEFYTPDWLAEFTLRQAGFPTKKELPSILDPSCGSGTFLFVAIRLLKDAGKSGSELVDFVENHLAGLDVHPLAIIIAKINLVLALRDDLCAYKKHFHLPIYMADALLLSVEKNEDLMEIPVHVKELSRRVNKEYNMHMQKTFVLPTEMARDPDKLNSVINALVAFANPSIDDSTAIKGFKRKLEDLGVPKQLFWVWRNNYRLMRWLLSDPPTDSVWTFLLKNAYRPALFAEQKFAFIVGNPPWLAYRFIKRRDYQEKVRKLFFDQRLLDKKEGKLFAQIELATLFFSFCSEKYLLDNGIIAFVMPRSVLTGSKQHKKFQEYYLTKVNKIIDCEQVDPLFNVPACVLIWDKASDSNCVKPFVLKLAGKLPAKNVSWDVAKNFLNQKKLFYRPPVSRGQSFYYHAIRQGASIVPRCFWFVRPLSDAIVTDYSSPQIQTDEKVLRQAKKPWNFVVKGQVESEFLFATLLSSDLVPFGWRDLSLIVLPLLVKHNSNTVLLNSESALSEGKIYLSNWLKQLEDLWKKYSMPNARINTIYDRLNYNDNLVCQHLCGVFKLLYNASGTNLCSVVVHKDMRNINIYDFPVRGFVADTKTYFYETNNFQEAHFLCAILNSRYVDNFIKPFQTKGAFGSKKGKGERDIHRRPFEVLPIPRFDSKNDIHLKLAKISVDCHEKVSKYINRFSPKILSMQIGKLRQKIRSVLNNELHDIDLLVKKILAE